MALKDDQLSPRKKRHVVAGGVVLPTSNFWLGGSIMGGGLTMATQGEEANESPSENESGETSAPTSGAAGGDAAAGAVGGGAGGSM
jgi:hypothetical protein